MRIIAGIWRGRTIYPPKNTKTRPTTDRVRESLMSVVSSARGGFDGACVLDAFAGSGALGLEALSRGAASCTFCEKDRDALAALSRNLEAVGLADAVRTAGSRRGGARGKGGRGGRGGGWAGDPGFTGAEHGPGAACGAAVVPAPAPRASVRSGCVLSRPPVNRARPYDLVFLDPPYALEYEQVLELLATLERSGSLAPDALVSYEHDAAKPLPERLAVHDALWVRLQAKRYGDTAIDVFGKKPGEGFGEGRGEGRREGRREDASADADADAQTPSEAGPKAKSETAPGTDTERNRRKEQA